MKKYEIVAQNHVEEYSRKKYAIGIDAAYCAAYQLIEYELKNNGVDLEDSEFEEQIRCFRNFLKAKDNNEHERAIFIYNENCKSNIIIHINEYKEPVFSTNTDCESVDLYEGWDEKCLNLLRQG